MKKALLITLSSVYILHSNAQFAVNRSDTITCQPTYPLNKWIAPAALVTAAGASFYSLNKSWYSNYSSSSFHFVNDMNNWRMMDKGGHAWSAYTIARLSAPLWQLSGKSHKQAVWAAGITALSYQSIIEVCDGFSSKWGFSWGDMAANTTGTLTYVAQELLLNQQVVHIKFASFKPIHYDNNIQERADELFGHTFTSRLLNDYNAQTYWASVNMKAIFPKTKIPAWFNMAVGYGARQLFGETDNRWMNKNDIAVDYSNIPRYSRFLLSPDIDFTKIKTNQRWLRVLLYMANAIKIPAPTLEYHSTGKLKFHALLLN